LSDGEREDAIAFTRRVVEEAAAQPVPIFAISARAALEAALAGRGDQVVRSGLPDLERFLRTSMLEARASIVVAAVAKRARSLVGDLLNSVEVEERGIALSEERLADVGIRMRQVFDEAEQRRHELRAVLNVASAEILSSVEADLAAFAPEEQRRLCDHAVRFLNEQGDVRVSREPLETLLRSTLVTDIDTWRAREERVVRDRFHAAIGRLCEQATAIIDETVRLTGGILGLELSTAPIRLDVGGRTGFSFSFFQPPTIVESILPDVRRVLPSGVVARLVERDLRRRIPELVDRHRGRLRWDFQQRLEATSRTVMREVDDRLAAAVDALRRAIERSHTISAENLDVVERRRAELASRRADLEIADWVFRDLSNLASEIPA
jgi:hypothetical protein